MNSRSGAPATPMDQEWTSENAMGSLHSFIIRGKIELFESIRGFEIVVALRNRMLQDPPSLLLPQTTNDHHLQHCIALHCIGVDPQDNSMDFTFIGLPFALRGVMDVGSMRLL